jgi:hypothetical protein
VRAPVLAASFALAGRSVTGGPGEAALGWARQGT